MTGGNAIVLDLRETLDKRTNFEYVELMALTEPECESYQEQLVEMLDEHIKETESPWATKIRQNLAHYLDYFMVIVPKTTGQAAVTVTPLRVVK